MRRYVRALYVHRAFAESITVARGDDDLCQTDRLLYPPSSELKSNRSCRSIVPLNPQMVCLPPMRPRRWIRRMAAFRVGACCRCLFAGTTIRESLQT